MKFVKKLLFFMLAISMVVMLVPAVSVSAEDSAPTTDATPQGTPITSAAELAAIQSSGSYYLANDILITGEWKSPVSFSGTLDGNGHTIVFSGATVKGGLFNSLMGATIKNLGLSDGKGEKHMENTWKMKSLAIANQQFTGVLADLAFGTVENVISNVDLGNQGIIGSCSAGGLIACQNGGDLTMKNCVNLAPVQAGYYGGGIVATSYACEMYTLTISECVNYGDVFSKNTAGGIVGHVYGRALKVEIEKCVNFGEITIATNNQAGGIAGYLRPAKESAEGGVVSITGCINFGMVHNIGIDNGGSNNGQYGGILARINTNKGDIILKNNINYAELAPAAKAVGAEIVGILAHHNGAKYITCSGNYSAPVTQLKDVTIYSDLPGGYGDPITDNTFDTLNAGAPGIFVKGEDGKIGLAWMKSMELTDEEPTLEFEVDYSSVGVEVPGGDEGENNENQKPDEDETGNNQPSGNDSETNASPNETETKAPEEKKGGCGSAISSASMLAVMAVLAVVSVVIRRKKVLDK